MHKFALAGNPNSGKTTLFNALTGSTAYVGNWAGVTVEKRAGKYRKLDEHVEIVDLPGIYSLSPYTPEEVVSRNYLLQDKPDVIINIVDATNLERNLYLTLQLLETDIPVVIALNMTDVLKKRGDSIDMGKLSERLGMPVVSISALRGEGIHELMKIAYAQVGKERVGNSVLSNTRLSEVVDKFRSVFQEREIPSPLFHAVKLIEGDEIESQHVADIIDDVEAVKKASEDQDFGSDWEARIADLRYRYITDNLSECIIRSECKEKLTLKGKLKVLKAKITRSPIPSDIDNYKYRDNLTVSDKIDRVMTSRVLGIPMFFVIMFFVFHFTFSEDLFYMKALYGVNINWWVFEDCGIPSLGVFLQSALGWCTDSLTAVVSDALSSAAPWVSSLICDGLFSGVFSVLSFLPQIALLFVFLSILEDSGYMARAAFIMDRAFRKFGLSGKSFMPLLMGFGCSVPAMMATRTLEHDKERAMTVYMTPWFSCSAKMPIYSAIAAAVFGGNDLAVYGMYVLGIVCAVLGSLLLRHTAFKGETAPFIMELPNYHLPQLRSLTLHVWDKVKEFIIRAGTIIAASAIVIWFLSNFDWSYTYLAGNIEQSILHDIGSIVSWIFYPLGFGIGEYGWVFIVAAFTGLIAKEEVVATLAVLGTAIGNLSATAGEEEAIATLFQIAGISDAAVVAFMAFNLLAIPCFAAVGAARNELGKGKLFKGAIAWWVLSAYTVSMIIFLIGSWWWTCFIFLAVVAVAATLIVLHNKGKFNFPSGGIKRLLRRNKEKA